MLVLDAHSLGVVVRPQQLLHSNVAEGRVDGAVLFVSGGLAGFVLEFAEQSGRVFA